MKHVEIYTDGACRGNPGRGGWGAILVYGGVEKELSGGEAETTNNRMELSAVLNVLKWLNRVQKEPCKIIFHTVYRNDILHQFPRIAGCNSK